MQGFAHRHTVQAALAWLDAQLRSRSTPKTCRCARPPAACSRAPVVSDVDVPGFDRATMDGYAVVADTTEGATSYNRLATEGHRRRAAGTPVRRLAVASARPCAS